MKPEFYIIDPETPSEIEGGCSARGPYTSVRAAEKWLRDDCRDTLLDADKSCRELDGMAWGSPMMIVQVVRRVQPSPKISVAVTLCDLSNTVHEPQAPQKIQ